MSKTIADSRIWTNSPDKIAEEYIPELTEKEMVLAEEFRSAKIARFRWEEEWRRNEVALLDTGIEDGALRYSPGSIAGVASAIPESANDAVENFMGMNISARNMQILHSQLMSNAPIMSAVPQSKDNSDREAAKGHEKALSHIREDKNITEWIALGTLQMFYYGFGVVKQVYDKSAGAYEADVKTGALKPIGDIKFSNPLSWNIWFDANATSVNTITKVWERLHFDYHAAKAFFGQDLLGLLAGQRDIVITPNSGMLPQYFAGTVSVYERWEVGTAANGFKGKLIYHLENGRLLKEIETSPCQFNMFPKASNTTRVKVARLPYTIFSYEDVPGSPYARSPVAKCNRAQRILNASISNIISTARNMGTPKLMCERSAINEKTLTDDSIQVIDLDTSGGGPAGSGSQFPAVLQGASTSQDMKFIVEQCMNHINEQWGINDAMLGKQGRETQGITLQLSIQQGNLIRERMFDKYVTALTDLNKLALAYAVGNWPRSKWEMVLGKEDEHLLESSLNADVEGGYTIHIERNMLLGLDPISRQEQLIRLQPIFEKAGMDQTYFVRLFQIADLRGLYDQYDQADTRAKKNLKYIIENKGEFPKIYKYEKHIAICAYLQEYVGTVEFDELKDELKDAINKFIDARMQMEAEKSTGGQPTPTPPAGAGAPVVGAPTAGMPM
jgi:hypothetical protein